MTDETAGALFKAGKLADAIAAANAALRAAPTDLGARMLLAELLLFAGNFERADVMLDAASGIDPGAAVVVAEFRQLLRAEMARRQLHRDGRMPEFLGEPTPPMRAALAAIVALRAGDAQGATREAAIAESERPRVPGTHNDHAFDDFRDADDNRLKRLVPIWKKEFFADGEVWVEGEWDQSAPRVAPG
jgi:type VI secretion system protein ImpE